MAKNKSILQKIIMYVILALILFAVPALITFFAQPKYGVFDGIAAFMLNNNAWVFIAVFATVVLLRLFVKKKKAELLKGAAVYIGAWIAGSILNRLFSGILHMHMLAWLFLIYVLMYFAYYYFEELPGFFAKVGNFTARAMKTAGMILAWVWLALLIAAVPFIILGMAKNNDGFSDFFTQNFTGISLIFFAVQAAWRRFAKGKKFDLLLSAGIFIVTACIALILRPLVLKMEWVDVRIYNYFAALLSAYDASYETAVLGLLVKIRGVLLKHSESIIKKVAAATVEYTGSLAKKSADRITEIKAKRVKAAIIIGALAAAVLLFNVTRIIYENAFVYVLSISPKGEVGQNVLISAEFSKPAALKDADITKLGCFTIKPPIKGHYSFENGKIVMFTPDEALKPSTQYTVTMDPAGYFKAPGKQVTGSPGTVFNTPYMNVVDSRFFANRDIMKNVEKEVVGEINFNYPVDGAELKKWVEAEKITLAGCNPLAKKEEPVDFSIEDSETPTRYYIKVPGISSSFDCQQIRVKIKAGIKCAECTLGMQKDFEGAVDIEKRVKLSVESVAPWHTEGSTLLAVKFNMPVSAEQVEKFVTVTRRATVDKPAEVVPFTVKTEYCYAVLTADFEPNLTYDVSAGKGIISKTGEPMDNNYSTPVNIEDMPSSLDYAEQGEIMSPDGEMNLALRVMNLDKINVRLYKVFKNNLVYYLKNGNAEEFGRQVYNGDHDITGGKINQEITEYINFNKFSKEPYKGIFVTEISDLQNRWESKRKLVRCTDLGMIAKTSGRDLIVRVVSVSTLSPLDGITVKLVSQTNQVIKEQKTDVTGKTVFRDWRENVYNFQPFIALAENGDDFSYLKFDGSELNNYSFDTNGEPTLEDGMKAFLTSDRGLYRPGETANLTAVIRNNDLAMPPQITVENRITGPQGEVIQSDKKAINKEGMAIFVLNTSMSSPTGEYKSEIWLNNDRMIGSTTFKVEEFIPDKLTVDIKTLDPEVAPGSPLLFTVKANQMFGPPAAGNKAETEVKFIDYTFQSAKFKDYTFRDPQKTFAEKYERLGTVNLDPVGEYQYNVPIPTGANPPSALEAEIYTQVFDDGGRPVGAYKTVPVHLYKYYLGAKLDGQHRSYKRGDTIDVDIAAVNSKDELQNVKNVEVVVKRKVWYSIFRTTGWNREQYDSSAYEEAVLYKTIDINGLTDVSFTADVEGEYSVYIGSEEKMRTGLTVEVSGPGFTTYDMSNADKITISTDKDKYSAGDTAVVTIKAPFDGMAYVSLDRDKVYFEKYVQIINGSASFNVPVDAQYLPNVYISVVAFRKALEKYESLPFVAYGIKNLTVDKAIRDLKPKISCKDEVMSTEGINVSVAGMPAGTAAVIAAVDEGILQIIRFETPDPLSFFYAKKSLQTVTYTIFNKLLTDIKAQKLAIGGDMEGGPMRKHLNPVQARNESYAKFSGIVFADEAGNINYKFDTNKFNGKVRVMIFTVKRDKFGSDSRHVNVVDPIVITPTMPRFLAPGDEFFMPVRIYNNTAVTSDFSVKVSVDGPVEFEKSVQSADGIKSKGEKLFMFRGRATADAGKAVFDITADGAGVTMNVKRELAVRPAAHLETRVIKGEIAPGGELKFSVPSNYITQGKIARVCLSYSRAAEYAGAFDYLIQYPYGCIEQTTSSAFPLIFYKDLGITKMLMENQGINTENYINDAIKRLRKFVLPGNRLTFWPGGSYDAPDWVKLYTANFVIEAKLKGYFVPDDIYNSILISAGVTTAAGQPVVSANAYNNGGDSDGGDAQENNGDGGDSDSGSVEPTPAPTDIPRLDRRSLNRNAYNFETNIYRLYLKTLLNTPDDNTMKYYEDLYSLYEKKNLNREKALGEDGYTPDKIIEMQNSLEKQYLLKGSLMNRTAADFVNGLSETDKFLLSMAYSQHDNQAAARMVIFDDFKSKYMVRELNGFFNSYARNLGMYLAALARAGGKDTPRMEYDEELLLKQLKDDGSFGNTQDTAWSLIGLYYAEQARSKAKPLYADIYVNGALNQATGGKETIVMSDSNNAWKDIMIKSKDASKFYYNIYVEGTPKEKAKSGTSRGLKIYRKYYNENGGEANLSSITQGELVVVSLTLEPQSGRELDNVVVEDMLPAGFEIENPRLKTRGSLKFTPASNFDAVYEDIRDDRMLLFTGKFTSPMTFSYTVRAVTPGKFVIPNAYAEAMYDPDIKAESFEGDYLIVAPNKF